MDGHTKPILNEVKDDQVLLGLWNGRDILTIVRHPCFFYSSSIVVMPLLLLLATSSTAIGATSSLSCYYIVRVDLSSFLLFHCF